MLYNYFLRVPDSSCSPGPETGNTSTATEDSTDKILGENLTEKVTVSFSASYAMTLYLEVIKTLS